jgi:CheY-like chemotaxis protein
VKKLLVVDDEDAIRKLIRLNLGDAYEIVETGDPEQALAMALEHKPNAILLDLRMPRYSGYELCQTFTSFSATQLIPVMVITGEGGSKVREFCRDLGVVAFFEKPVDFAALRDRLEEILKFGRSERRREVRVRLSVSMKLRGHDADGKSFEALTTSENVSLNGFSCACPVALATDSLVEVYLIGSQEPVGIAQVVRSDSRETEYPRYGCRFTRKTGNWILQ